MIYINIPWADHLAYWNQCRPDWVSSLWSRLITYVLEAAEYHNLGMDAPCMQKTTSSQPSTYLTSKPRYLQPITNCKRLCFLIMGEREGCSPLNLISIVQCLPRLFDGLGWLLSSKTFHSGLNHYPIIL